jgi:SAM-dependent methyltransferase
LEVDAVAIFDGMAEQYDKWFDQHWYAYVSECRAIHRLLPITDNGIEIGAGTGRFAVPLGIRVAVEPSEAMADIARSRGLDVTKAFGEELPFRDATFDFALLVNVLCFVKDPLPILREARRVIKPAGRLIIAFFDRESDLGRQYEKKKESSPFYNPAKFYSSTEIVSFLSTVGLSVRKACQTIVTDPKCMKHPDPVLYGVGQGLFVVMSAMKN